MTNETLDISPLDALLRGALKDFAAPGAAVGIVRQDEEPVFLCSGVKALGGADLVGPDSQFGIGSITKGVAAAALALLVDEGKVKWDDLAREQVPWFRLADPLADGQVTIRDLLCHRTGLARHEMLWYQAPWDRKEVIRRIGLVAPDAPIRSRYSYQNIMYAVMGEAIAAASGRSWESFVKARLFDPLGMTKASFEIAGIATSRDRADPHEKKHGQIAQIPFVSYDNIGAAGTINASVREMIRWARFQLGEGEVDGKRLVSVANLRETHTPQIVAPLDDDTRALYPETMQESYGLGWRIWDYRGHFALTHGGETDGFTAQIALLAREGIGLVILSNLSPTCLPQALRNSLIDALLGLPPRDWNRVYLAQAEKWESRQLAEAPKRIPPRRPDTKPSRELAAYAGDYEDPAYGSLQIALVGESLTLQWSRWACALAHWHFDVFITPDDGTTLEKHTVAFTLDAAAEPCAVRFLEREFRRKIAPQSPAESHQCKVARSQ